jgi:hypothetical protein
MSLVKGPRMTENKQAANRRNRKLARGTSPYERAAEIAPTHSHTTLLQRMEDSTLHQLRRLTTAPAKVTGAAVTHKDVKDQKSSG